MSVPVWKRNAGTLDLFMLANDFAVHILKITSNENIFIPIFKESITNKINELAISIYTNLWKANITKLSEKNYNQRLSFQTKALYDIDDFLAIWNLAIRAFHLKKAKSNYVIEKILMIQEISKKWINSDINRLKELQQVSS